MTAFHPEELARLQEQTFLQRVDFHPELGSTNDLALQLSSEPHLETPLLILAETQTAGRGRGSNRWWSNAGALTFSIIIEPQLLDLSQDRWPRIALVAGLALCDLLQDLLPEAECGIKWPNDVWLNRRKVAGLLVEIPPASYPVPQRIVVGMGVNVNNSWQAAPEEIAAKGIAMCDVAGKEFSRTLVLSDWLQHFARSLDQLANQPQELVGRWKTRCVLTGKNVEIQQGNTLVRGCCRGIDDQGALLVEGTNGLQRLFGGIVSAIGD